MDIDQQRELLSSFFDTIEKAQDGFTLKLNACDATSSIEAKKICENEAITTEKQEMALSVSSGMRTACSKLFPNDTGKNPKFDGCVANASTLKLESYLTENFASICNIQQANGNYKSDYCLKAALEEAKEKSDPKNANNLDLSVTLQEFANLQKTNQFNYYNFLWGSLTDVKNSNSPASKAYAEFNEKLEGYLPKTNGKTNSNYESAEKKAVLLYRYLSFMDASNPTSELYKTSEECKKGNASEINACEIKNFQYLTKNFFAFQCPTALEIPNSEKPCTELGAAMEKVWTARAASCVEKERSLPKYNGQTFYCYQDIIHQAATSFAATDKKIASQRKEDIPSPFLDASGKPLFDFSNPIKITERERAIIAGFELSNVETGILGAIEKVMPDGSGNKFITNVVEQLGVRGQNMLKAFVDYIRSADPSEPTHTQKDIQLLNSFQLCIKDSKSKETAKCHENAVSKFESLRTLWFDEICSKYFDDGSKNKANEPCAKFKIQFEEMLKTATSKSCKPLKEDGNFVATEGHPTFSCIAQTMRTAADFWNNPSKNPFLGWSDERRLITQNNAGQEGFAPLGDLIPTQKYQVLHRETLANWTPPETIRNANGKSEPVAQPDSRPTTTVDLPLDFGSNPASEQDLSREMAKLNSIPNLAKDALADLDTTPKAYANEPRPTRELNAKNSESEPSESEPSESSTTDHHPNPENQKVADAGTEEDRTNSPENEKSPTSSLETPPIIKTPTSRPKSMAENNYSPSEPAKQTLPPEGRQVASPEIQNEPPSAAPVRTGQNNSYSGITPTQIMPIPQNDAPTSPTNAERYIINQLRAEIIKSKQNGLKEDGGNANPSNNPKTLMLPNIPSEQFVKQLRKSDYIFIAVHYPKIFLNWIDHGLHDPSRKLMKRFHQERLSIDYKNWLNPKGKSTILTYEVNADSSPRFNLTGEP